MRVRYLYAYIGRLLISGGREVARVVYVYVYILYDNEAWLIDRGYNTDPCKRNSIELSFSISLEPCFLFLDFSRRYEIVLSKNRIFTKFKALFLSSFLNFQFVSVYGIF